MVLYPAIGYKTILTTNSYLVIFYLATSARDLTIPAIP